MAYAQSDIGLQGVHPTRVVDKRATAYGECHCCNLYSALFTLDGLNLFCRDCFDDIEVTKWETTSQERLEVVKKKRLEEAFAEECKKRHTKGHCPINLRR